MRLLLDNNLSRKLAVALRDAGHDVVHVRDLELHKAPDAVILETARTDARVLVSADTDFGTLLAHSHAVAPSFVLMRRIAGHRVEEQAALILGNLALVEEDLNAGAVIVLGETTLRIHRLPIGNDS